MGLCVGHYSDGFDLLLTSAADGGGRYRRCANSLGLALSVHCWRGRAADWDLMLPVQVGGPGRDRGSVVATAAT
ncbi:hypothetical protein L6452_32982 [Arctium lappa]|uniref:Uncharacterized protein n=1 Tax=Arctium lappa TaxID=4217 RepID=A0ACB8Z6Q7_ARCLA|nr:hypothetical protein L6452_32982 [Arctium lappa]